MRAKFGRELREGRPNFNFDTEFEVESYLRHQGKAFVDRFDANTYLLITKTLDYFDPAADFDSDLSAAFHRTQARFLVVAFTSDWRFAPPRSREIVRALVRAGREVTYAEIPSEYGHDAFLMPIPLYHQVLRDYLTRVAREVTGPAAEPAHASPLTAHLSLAMNAHAA
jgi:homoserine O-acetyltransferase